MRAFAVGFLFILFIAPWSALAKTTTDELEVSGWIPYWQGSMGIKDAKKHLSSLDAVYPFAFTVTIAGELRDQAGLDHSDWRNFTKAAKKKDVLVIPTVMSGDGMAIYGIIANPVLRKMHVEHIVDMVKEGDFDGVDIDYEGRKADSKEYFSAFLTELKAALGDKILSCTVEPRTPPDSLYKTVPATLSYSYDYAVIGEVCDRIQIMAYDQQRADLKLNTSKNGAPYIPVADVDWVRKVVELATESLPKDKIVLGVPTYGVEWAVTVYPDWFKSYSRIGARNMDDMRAIARKNKVTPTRNKAGEMSFTYLPKDSSIKLSSSLRIPSDTPKGNITAARALAYANKTGNPVTVNVGWYSDARAIKDKIDLAKEFGIRGVALFKIDGEEDPKVWNYLR
ncbi:MAG TPA: glycosyl hydrolase family 18 protein [Candidatus Paceibacterota bacterium]|nr:glycosyl hydrolase family 18 protein [Candidatus Paceibacterota bacterium]